jgi:hypothetical protein
MANVKISALTALSTMTDATVVPVVESATTKKITGLDLKDYMNKTKEITHAANVLAAGTNTGDGSSIAITDNYHTEKVLITNVLGDVGRATLPNVSVYGKTVILVTSAAHGIYVDRNIWNAAMGYVGVSNSSNGVVILMSLGSNGWKQIQRND